MMDAVKPHRVQRKRVKGWRMPENTICVDRSTKWGNPFRVVRIEQGIKVRFAVIDRNGNQRGPDYERYRSAAARAVDLFQQYAKAQLMAQLSELKGKNLACWCKSGDPCHADVLLELANQRQ